MKDSLFFRTYDYIVTWIIGVTFLLAGVPHWENCYFFLGSVYSYSIVAPGLGQMVAAVLPLIQLVLSILLLLRFYSDAAHVVCLFLFAGFAFVQTTAFLRDLDISCGCFGPDHESIIGWKTLSLVYGLLILSAGRCTIILRRKK
jgi:hypothetical protein